MNSETVELDAGDLAEAGLVRARDLLDLLEEQLRGCGHGNDRMPPWRRRRAEKSTTQRCSSRRSAVSR